MQQSFFIIEYWITSRNRKNGR